METLKPTPDFHSSVDTSRPFRSVKEAVAIFGERILVGEIYSPNHPSTGAATTPSPHNNTNNNNYVNSITSPPSKFDRKYSTGDHHDHDQNILDALKKVEAELEETRAELKLLKEREQETEVAVASLNAELHKNMSKLAEAEAAKAAAAAAGGTVESRGIIISSYNGDNKQQEERIIRRRELVRRMEKNPTLAQILSLGEKDLVYSRGRKRERKIIKRKPIVPLVGDLFSRKK
ncbi:WEB family protein [Parasponia andersonii]|uniref:WEB family protein n=1 Tax=Parasponia andersonii TaxID=3476 RepID=A0A2P5BJ38_PARAD|nr:WEB family protein [Parasponia andersonii]